MYTFFVRSIVKIFAMDNIEVDKIKGKGRGIVAKKIFKVGDLILKEDAFAVTVMAAYSKSTCHFCLNSNAFVSLKQQ